MTSAQPLRMDVFIAGLGRAGTTLLANLLTSPPKRWLLVEPGITRGDMGEHVRVQAEQVGIAITSDEWTSVADEQASERFDRLLRSRLATLERWGVKEVNPAGWDALLEQFSPRNVVLMVRDLRDAGISVLEKEARNTGQRKSPEWLFERLDSAARELVRLHTTLPAAQVTIVRYEDLVSSEAERLRIASRLDWPLDGDPRQRLDLYGRSFENQRHGGKVTTGSIGRAVRATSEEHRSFADRLRDKNDAFARAFGYK